MPLYEYTCPACQIRFEALVRGGEAPACPRCGSKRIEKEFSVFSAAKARSDGPPGCFTGQGGCDLGRCGSGRCGFA
ncbi:MAG: zinc ribbon domain-containing protein [Planctomycetota bacterium]